MNATDPTSQRVTRLALLATMGALYAEPLAYDSSCLRTLVIEMAPGLL